MSTKVKIVMPAWNVVFDTRVKVDAPDIASNIAQIHALAGVIRGIPIPPSVQRNLDRLNITRAVRGTTGIEGTELSEEEVGLILETPSDRPVLSDGREREEQEVRNAESLMVHVAERVENNPGTPISEEIVKEFHYILTSGITYPDNIPGQYRSHSVSVSTYVPPRDGEEIRRLMSEFVRWLNTDTPSRWDSVIRAIVAHFYVISIHPFGDGNGRTSRAVESYLLYQAGVNARGYYSLANYYYSRRSEYVATLDHVRFESCPDLTPFVMFALRGLVEELTNVYNEVLAVVRRISFRDFAREMLTTTGKIGTPGGQRQLSLLNGLSTGPVSIKALRSGQSPLSALYKNLTPKTLTRDINFLKQQQLVVLDGDELGANLEIMTSYTAIPARAI